jgi:hypothetical protein
MCCSVFSHQYQMLYHMSNVQLRTFAWHLGVQASFSCG